jgi:hypothetical protein
VGLGAAGRAGVGLLVGVVPLGAVVRLVAAGSEAVGLAAMRLTTARSTLWKMVGTLLALVSQHHSTVESMLVSTWGCAACDFCQSWTVWVCTSFDSGCPTFMRDAQSESSALLLPK